MNILIVDDEKMARDRLDMMIRDIPGCRVVGYAGDGVESVYKTYNLNVDVVLMDIRLPKMSGLEAARHINATEHPPLIIFTTSFQEYAFESFSMYPAGYLLKPVRRSVLENTLSHLQRIRLRQVAEPIADDRHEEHYITCTCKDNINLIPLSNIRYMISHQKYTQIVHEGEYAYTLKPLKEFEAMYSDRLLRIHRNCLINKNYLRGLEKNKITGNCEVRLYKVEKTLPVSRRNLPALRDFVKTFSHPTNVIRYRDKQLRNRKGRKG